MVLALVMALFAYKFVEKDQEIHRLQAQANALQTANYQTSRDNQSIRRSLPYYQSTDYVAEQARDLLGYTFPGDTLVHTAPVAAPVERVRRPPPPPPAAPKPTWQQWWDAFFG